MTALGDAGAPDSVFEVSTGNTGLQEWKNPDTTSKSHSENPSQAYMERAGAGCCSPQG